MAVSGDSSMQRTFSLLEYMSRKKRSVSLQELSEDLSLSTAAVQRLLNGLIESGYAAQEPDHLYHLTYKLYQVAGSAMDREHFLRELIPYMNYFALRYGYEIGLTVFYGDTILHILNVGQNINFGTACLRPGQLFPVYCSASGKVLLAQMGDDALRAWIQNHALLPYTVRTIIDKEQLYREILRTRAQGYGVGEGELFDIVYAAAFPIHDQDGAVVGTFNFRMLPEVYEENMRGNFVNDVKLALNNFGL